MSRGKTIPEPELLPPEPQLPLELAGPEIPERTRLEMDYGRQMAAQNAAALERAIAARTLEAAAKAAQDADEKRRQAEDKARVVAEAEAAHAAKVSPPAESSV
jgi:hypothetical protein